MIPRDKNFHNGELTDHLYWEVEKELADCYPLPDFEKHMVLPLFDEEAMNIPVNKGGLSQISDEYYSIWAARFAQQQSVALLGQRVGLSDLWRYWMLLRGAHKQLHVLLDKASTDPGSLVLGNYLALSIYHAGVESLMRDTKNQLMKYYPMRG